MAFYTSNEYSGDQGGIEGADDICQQEADLNSSLVPSGSYKALLATGRTVDGQSVTLTNSVPARPAFRLGNSPLTNIFGNELLPNAWLIVSQVDLPLGFETITDSAGNAVVTS